MSYGYTFDEDMRQKIIEAAATGERSKLNAVIMEIQQPLIDKLDAIKELLK